MWSDISPAMDGVDCLSILLEEGVTVSSNFTERLQNWHKRQVQEAFELQENLISNEMVICTILLQSVISLTILYVHKLSHAPRILSLGSLWLHSVIPSITDIWSRKCDHVTELMLCNDKSPLQVILFFMKTSIFGARAERSYIFLAI